MTRTTSRSHQVSQQQLSDTQGLLQNLTSLQLNSHIYANWQHIHQILARTENGVWAASKQFPRTVFDFINLNRADMEALQNFYNIQFGCGKSLSDETSLCGLDNMLFVEIARTFGLTFWVRDEMRHTPYYQD